jgi:argininosuccinate lyase
MAYNRSRLKKPANENVLKYTESISFDSRLYRYDIAGSIVHTRMLGKQKIISSEDAQKIVNGLKEIRDEIEYGKFKFLSEHEDIHMNIEARLAEKIGTIAGKLHTARSRNDQVALDLRLYLKEVISDITKMLRGLQLTLVNQAENNVDVIIPGYTHLQHAQPVLLAHHLLAYFEMFQRDIERFAYCLNHTDVLPLGSGALAGVTFNIDRKFVARELGFEKISRNSMDAVADRDFVIEFESTACICMMHVSRIAEEIILWSTKEFGFIELDEAYTTGSSIMPQKKNPDVAELARGKTGRIYGNLVAILTTMKALPLTYNRDMQEDKEGLFDTIDCLTNTLSIFIDMIITLSFNTVNISKAVEGGYMLATDLTDYLVKKGMPFRQAHAVVGKLVSFAIDKHVNLADINLVDYKTFSTLFDNDVKNITLESSIKARDVNGGTAYSQVKEALNTAKILLGETIVAKE